MILCSHWSFHGVFSFHIFSVRVADAMASYMLSMLSGQRRPIRAAQLQVRRMYVLVWTCCSRVDVILCATNWCNYLQLWYIGFDTFCPLPLLLGWVFYCIPRFLRSLCVLGCPVNLPNFSDLSLVGLFDMDFVDSIGSFGFTRVWWDFWFHVHIFLLALYGLVFRFLASNYLVLLSFCKNISLIRTHELP